MVKISPGLYDALSVVTEICISSSGYAKVSWYEERKITDISKKIANNRILGFMVLCWYHDYMKFEIKKKKDFVP